MVEFSLGWSRQMGEWANEARRYIGLQQNTRNAHRMRNHLMGHRLPRTDSYK